MIPTAHRRRRASAAAFVLALGLLPLIAAPVGAAASVNSDATLRAAFGDVTETQINFSSDITLECTGNVTRGTVPTPATGTLLIDGNNHTLTNPCADQSAIWQQYGTAAAVITVRDLTIVGQDTSVFGVYSNQKLVIENMTITGNGGGGVFSQGDVSVSGSTITGNSNGVSSADAVTSSGVMVVTNSTISNNGTGASVRNGINANNGLTVSGSVINGNGGDGIYTTDETTVTNTTIDGNEGNGIRQNAEGTPAFTVRGSTISGNGDNGIRSNADVTVINSTITANDSAGVLAAGELTVNFSTITGNDVNLFNGSPNTIHLHGTVLADADSNDCQAPAPAQSTGGNWADDTSCGLTGTGDVQSSGGDPMLGALAANGGPTRTRLPAAGSPLIDKLACGGTTVDQRGLSRPQGVRCDTGAVEVAQAAPGQPVPTPPATDIGPSGGTGGDAGWATLGLFLLLSAAGTALALAHRRQADDSRR